jgi:hypothetical protein
MEMEVKDQYVIIPDFKITEQLNEIQFEKKETKYEFEFKE